MELHSPAADLLTFVASASGGDLVASRDLFEGFGYPLPQGFIAQFIDAPSPGPDPYVQGETPAAYVRAQVQVLVWGMSGRDGYEQTRELAFEVAGYLQQATVSGYVSVRLAAMPSPVGDPKAPRPAWSFTVQAEYRA